MNPVLPERGPVNGCRLYLSVGLVLSLLTSAAIAIDVAMVTVGDPGNPADTLVCFDKTTGYGRVNYTYQIGKFHITAKEYVAFLNAVAATDTYQLYDIRMDYDADPSRWGCNIKRIGSPGSYTYSVAADWANRPVNWVSWGSSARFCNWLNNGQPTGEQGPSTTEDGSYCLNGASTDAELATVERKADAHWALPTEDEWYKAAYYDPHKPGGAGYWFCPTRSNAVPSNVLDPNGTNNACYYGYDGTGNGGWTIGPPYYRPEVGAFASSPGPYGTFDQGGNEWQRNEALNSDGWRGSRGGGFPFGFYGVFASIRGYSPEYGDLDIGFRVVLVPGRDKDNDGVPDFRDLCPDTPDCAYGYLDGNGCPIDSDNDGVVDGCDQCLGAPACASGAIDSHGCPIDADSDGVPDGCDECPNTPACAGGHVDDKGCPVDPDNDGVVDGCDQCPNTPACAFGHLDANGCPIDSDYDGLLDGCDACPDTPACAIGFVDGNGCPIDSDNDGLLDGCDACPNTPACAIGFVDGNGCPLDPDRDGVVDGCDACPNTAACASGHVDGNGCPIDSDNDGLSDGCDECPNTAAGEPVDANGCSTLDSDGDGVLNDRDQCPDSPSGGWLNLLTGCPTSRSDLNHDGDVDMNDFAILQRSLGSNNADADLNRDGDVDANDFAILRRCASGPGMPADSQCQ
jgi:formylglycine-generating enzyme required for sulfatase activity